MLYLVIWNVRKQLPADKLYKSGKSLELFYSFTSYVCRRFHPLHYRYEFVLLLRKSLLAIISFIVTENYSLQLLATFSVLFISASVHLKLEPFRTSDLNRMDAMLLTLLVVECLGTMILESTKPPIGSSILNDLNALESLRNSQNIFSQLIFWPVILIGIFYSLRIAVKTMRRADQGQGNESSGNAAERSMGRLYQTIFRILFFTSGVIVYIAYLVCSYIEKKEGGEIFISSLLWISSYMISTYMLFPKTRRYFSFKKSGQVQSDMILENLSHEKILQFGETLMVANNLQEYKVIRNKLLKPIHDVVNNLIFPIYVS